MTTDHYSHREQVVSRPMHIRTLNSGQIVAARSKETVRRQTISAPVWITLSVKIPSRMNLLNDSSVSVIPLRGNPG
jgi:hypothetical protein